MVEDVFFFPGWLLSCTPNGSRHRPNPTISAAINPHQTDPITITSIQPNSRRMEAVGCSSSLLVLLRRIDRALARIEARLMKVSTTNNGEVS
jgi:hypothetical protein